MISEEKKKEIWKKIYEHEEWIRTKGLKGKQLNLEDENLAGMRLLNVDLRDSNFKNADLRECIIFADLRGADLTGVKLENTKWTGSNINRITIEANKLNLIEYQLKQEADIHSNQMRFLKTNEKEMSMRM
ncbi:MAG: pentapeptide repeat-containing protein [Clostridium sp.]|nr:pentapeptide repeat-containing protein [Clostridium sp.]MDY6226515.1 pentapeptide repeat-containing protein [Clostridium sp.]